jgi:lactoylglutathione lyase
VTEVASLVLFAVEPEKTAGFYRAAGIALTNEDHGEGPVHFAAQVGSVHVAIYPAESSGRAPAARWGGSSFPGFYVDSLDAVTVELARLEAPLLSGHEEMPWVAGSSWRTQTGARWRSTSATTAQSSHDVRSDVGVADRPGRGGGVSVGV